MKTHDLRHGAIVVAVVVIVIVVIIADAEEEDPLPPKSLQIWKKEKNFEMKRNYRTDHQHQQTLKTMLKRQRKFSTKYPPRTQRTAN